jgi:hypothetical protein
MRPKIADQISSLCVASSFDTVSRECSARAPEVAVPSKMRGSEVLDVNDSLGFLTFRVRVENAHARPRSPRLIRFSRRAMRASVGRAI